VLTSCLLSPRAEPSGGASGQASDIAIHAKEILRVRRLLTGIYQKHCALGEENEDAGLQRFGKAHERWHPADFA
jgi:ATP-dependent Clp protease, protease subunit